MQEKSPACGEGRGCHSEAKKKYSDVGPIRGVGAEMASGSAGAFLQQFHPLAVEDSDRTIGL
jgi:hypothetical protein